MDDSDRVKGIIVSTANDYDMTYEEVERVYSGTCPEGHLTNEFYEELELELLKRKDGNI